MKNIEELEVLRKHAVEYSDYKYSAENMFINSDEDSMEQDKLYFFMSQTLDEILDILKSKEFGGEAQYGDVAKEIIGNAIVKSIDKL